MRSKKTIVAAAALVVVGALAAFAYRIYLNPARDLAVDLVPADSVVYGSVFLSPSTHQKQALQALLKHFPTARTPADAKDELERLLDRALAATAIDFTHDIEPWIGRQVAFFVEPREDGPEKAGVLISTRDIGPSTRAIRKLTSELEPSAAAARSYRDVGYRLFDGAAIGTVGDFVAVASNPDAFEDIVTAHDGESLGDGDDYRRVVASLPNDRVATLYVRTSGLATLLVSNPLVAGLLSGLPSVGAGAFLRQDAIVVDVAVPGGTDASLASGAAVLTELERNLPRPMRRLIAAGSIGTDSSPARGATYDAARAGLGPDYSMRGYLDPTRSFGKNAAKLDAAAREFVQHSSYMALGTRADHDTLFARIVIGVD